MVKCQLELPEEIITNLPSGKPSSAVPAFYLTSLIFHFCPLCAFGLTFLQKPDIAGRQQKARDPLPAFVEALGLPISRRGKRDARWKRAKPEVSYQWGNFLGFHKQHLRVLRKIGCLCRSFPAPGRESVANNSFDTPESHSKASKNRVGRKTDLLPCCAPVFPFKSTHHQPSSRFIISHSFLLSSLLVPHPPNLTNSPQTPPSSARPKARPRKLSTRPRGSLGELAPPPAGRTANSSLLTRHSSLRARRRATAFCHFSLFTRHCARIAGAHLGLHCTCEKLGLPGRFR